MTVRRPPSADPFPPPSRLPAVLRTATCWAVAGALLIGCSVARRANEAPPSTPAPPAIVPKVVAPPQAEGLDGTAGQAGVNVCVAVAWPLGKVLGVSVTAKPFSWNDGGLPALDLCTLVLDGRSVTIGMSALQKQPDSLDRLIAGSGTPALLPELGPDARISPSRVVFSVDDRAVRILAAGGIDRQPSGIDRAKAVAISRAVRTAVPRMIRTARQSDEACQLSTAGAERFIGTLVQLRRDYRMNGALTCIWGSFDATFSIVESFHPDSIPEARRTPPPQFAPVGRPGYYLPDQGELVFRQGRRVVRVSGLTNPAREVPLDTLLTVVGPLLPLFIK